MGRFNPSSPCPPSSPIPLPRDNTGVFLMHPSRNFLFTSKHKSWHIFYSETSNLSERTISNVFLCLDILIYERATVIFTLHLEKLRPRRWRNMLLWGELCNPPKRYGEVLSQDLRMWPHLEVGSLLMWLVKMRPYRSRESTNPTWPVSL